MHYESLVPADKYLTRVEEPIAGSSPSPVLRNGNCGALTHEEVFHANNDEIASPIAPPELLAIAENRACPELSLACLK